MLYYIVVSYKLQFIIATLRHTFKNNSLKNLPPANEFWFAYFSVSNCMDYTTNFMKHLTQYEKLLYGFYLKWTAHFTFRKTFEIWLET